MAKLKLRKSCYEGIADTKIGFIKPLSKEQKESINIKITKGKERYANAYLNAKNDFVQ